MWDGNLSAMSFYSPRETWTLVRTTVITFYFSESSREQLTALSPKVHTEYSPLEIPAPVVANYIAIMEQSRHQYAPTEI